MARSPRTLDDMLCFAVYDAQHAFAAAYRALLAPLGITYPQYLVLLLLWERDGQGVRALGARLHLDSGTLSPLLKRMEAAGLVERRRGTADERQVLVHLTARAQSLRGPAAGVQARLARAAGLSAAEVGACRAGLAALTGRLAPFRARGGAAA